MAKRKRDSEAAEAPLTTSTPASTPKKRRTGLVNGHSKVEEEEEEEEQNGFETPTTTPSKSTRSSRVASASKSSAVSDDLATPTPANGRKKQVNGATTDKFDDASAASTPAGTPSKRGRGRPGSSVKPIANGFHESTEDITPKALKKGKLLFSTPTKDSKSKGTVTTPTSSRKADRSARRKSARMIQEHNEADEEAWEDDDTLARQIRDEDDDIDVEEDEKAEVVANEGVEPSSNQPTMPSKKRGPRRLPTPEGDLPPQERYFFQNRSGSTKTSNNTLPSSSLLTHEEYFELIRIYKDPHDAEKAFLLDLHARSFPQWRFEFFEGFNICIYGWGSKRKLVERFAEWLYPKMEELGKIVIVNGYAPNVSVRSIFSTIMTALLGSEAPLKLPSNPSDLLALIFSTVSNSALPYPITLVINSLDASPLRSRTIQTLLARLASNPHINLLATTDTPNFPLLWDTTLRSEFNFVFHDCSTFAPYDAEITVVDDVHDLLGRSGRRVGGKDGIGFVLKSLPENARSLYRVLITETLSAMAEGVGLDNADDDDDGRKRGTEDVGVEYRHLYAKAAEEFICSNEMAFRTLLKEFHDHQMVVSRKDAGGTEVLSLPLGREEMEAVLEDLVVG
jgi:origin recognition complex subunit 2